MHVVIHHAKFTVGKVLKRWTVTSIDTDQRQAGRVYQAIASAS